MSTVSAPLMAFEIACQCGDFEPSHLRSDGRCCGWCDQTCTAFRPVEMPRTNAAWQAVIKRATQLAMPRYFTGDLFRDYQALTGDPSARSIYPDDPPPNGFLWGVRCTGTDLIRRDAKNVSSWFESVSSVMNKQVWFRWSGPADNDRGLLAHVTPDAARRFLRGCD